MRHGATSPSSGRAISTITKSGVHRREQGHPRLQRPKDPEQDALKIVPERHITLKDVAAKRIVSGAATRFANRSADR